MAKVNLFVEDDHVVLEVDGSIVYAQDSAEPIEPTPEPKEGNWLGFNLNDPAWYQSVAPFVDLATTRTVYYHHDVPPPREYKINIKPWGGRKLKTGEYRVTDPGSNNPDSSFSVVMFDEKNIVLKFTEKPSSKLSIRHIGEQGVFASTFADRARKAGCVRFMDPHRINSPEYDSSNPWVRKVEGARNTFEHSLITPKFIGEMAAFFKFSPWVCIHHHAIHEDIIAFATELKEGLGPDFGLPVIVEHSNEVWNGAFPQHRYAKEHSQGYKGYQADETDYIGEIFKGILPNVVVALGVQFDSPSLRNYIRNSERDLSYIDAVAIAPYFGGPPARRISPDEIEVMTNQEIIDFAEEDFEERVKVKMTQWLEEIGEQVGDWDVLGYEGGSHLAVANKRRDVAAQAKLNEASQSAAMGLLYRKYLDWWASVNPKTFNIYTDVSVGDGEPWGHRAYEMSPITPRWEAIEEVWRILNV